MSQEMKELVEGIKKDFDEYKKTNDERHEKSANGEAVAELDAKLVKIEEALTGQEAQKDRLEKIETAIKRGGFGQPSTGDQAKADNAELSGLVQKFMRKGKEGMSEKDADRARELEKKLLSVDEDPQGGYWVSPDQTGRVVKRVFETSPMRQVASVQQISTDSLEGIADTDEAEGEWVGEKIAPTEDKTPEIGKWSIPVHEFAARPKATQKLLEDSSVNVEQWLGGKVARVFSRRENTAFVIGDGVAKPRGFLDYAASATVETFDRETIGRVVTAAVSVIAFDDLIDLQTALKTEYEISSRWAMNRRVKGDVRKLKDNDDQYLWQPANQQGAAEMLLGRPLVMFDDMPNVADGSLSIALADWAEAYQIVDRIGISILRDPFTAKPFVEFYTRKRVGGDVINTDAVKILETQAV